MLYRGIGMGCIQWRLDDVFGRVIPLLGTKWLSWFYQRPKKIKVSSLRVPVGQLCSFFYCRSGSMTVNLEFNQSNLILHCLVVLYKKFD